MTFFLGFVLVGACLLVCLTTWCCLVVSSMASVQEEGREVSNSRSFWSVMTYNGDMRVAILCTRGEHFCLSYRTGYELEIMQLIWKDFDSGLLRRDEACEVADLVASATGVKVTV